MAKEMEQGEIEALANELETKMARLRSIYEQYFMGIERTPPTTLRKDIVRTIHTLESAHIRNTALKFKVRSLIQRFNSYKAYWRRVERQIEEGTYVRDIRRAERNREKHRERASRDEDDGIIEIDFEEIADFDLQDELQKMESDGAFEQPRPETGSGVDPAERERVRQARLAEISAQLGGNDSAAAEQPEAPRPAATASRGAPQSLSRPSGDRSQKIADIKRRMQERTGKIPGAATPRPAQPARSDDTARRVFDQLVEAKKRCNEPTTGLSYESVASSMEKQRRQLQQTRGATDVEFKVVIKDGRAFLKPETKK